MSKVNKSTIESIKSQIDIADLVESYGISLKRSGGDRSVGLCPFHDERSGSFNVYGNTESYYCFGCRESGDIFSFVMLKEGLSFGDAVHMLAEQAGVEVISDQERDPLYEKKQRYLEAHKLAARFYRMQFSRLDEDHIAVQNLIERNLFGDEAWREKFGIGYAPEGYNNLLNYLTSKEFEAEELVEFGLAGKSENGRYYDRFRYRLLWEIRDVRGHVVGFGGRKLNPEDRAKYLNTQQTILYNKSSVLYGLDLARKAISQSKTCYIVEGYTDVMAMHAVGIENVVASSGTAFGDGHAQTIRRLIDDFDATQNGDFVFVFDGDKAGQGAALATFKIQPSINERSYIVPMNDGDPCDVRLRDGDEELRNALTHRKPVTEFVLRSQLDKFDMRVPEQKDLYLRGAREVISSIQQISLREDYARMVSLWTGVDLGARYGEPNPSTGQPDMVDYPVQPVGPDTREITERRAVAAFIQAPQEVYSVVEGYDIDRFITIQRYNDILFDAMALVAAGERLSAEDFGDREAFLRLSNEPLEARNLNLFARRQFEILEKLNVRSQQQEMREKRAQRARNGEGATASDLLAALAQLQK